MEKKFNQRGKEKSLKGWLHFQVTESTELMPFLIEKIPEKSRNNIKSLLGYKQVLVDGEVVSQFNYPLVPGQKVEISNNRQSAVISNSGVQIVFEDDYLIVIDKPAGLLTIATKNEKHETVYSFLSNYVKKQDSRNKIFIVHRIDRETSGLLLFAKNEDVKLKLQDSWNHSIIDRKYIALVEGNVTQKEGVINSYLFEDKNFIMHSSQNQSKGKIAVTNFCVLKSNKYFSLLEVTLETGRKNQIRVHMQDIEHSIVGDKKYGAKTSPIKRLGLHAQKLSFIHPVSNKKMHFETSIPKIFNKVF